MIWSCKAIKFVVEEVVLREMCQNPQKAQKICPKWSEKNAEKGKKPGKSQEKMKTI